MLTTTFVAGALRSPPAVRVPCFGVISKNLLALIFDFGSGCNSNLESRQIDLWKGKVSRIVLVADFSLALVLQRARLFRFLIDAYIAEIDASIVALLEGHVQHDIVRVDLHGDVHRLDRAWHTLRIGDLRNESMHC